MSVERAVLEYLGDSTGNTTQYLPWAVGMIWSKWRIWAKKLYELLRRLYPFASVRTQAFANHCVNGIRYRAAYFGQRYMFSPMGKVTLPVSITVTTNKLTMMKRWKRSYRHTLTNNYISMESDTQGFFDRIECRQWRKFTGKIVYPHFLKYFPILYFTHRVIERGAVITAFSKFLTESNYTVLYTP